MRTTVTLDPDVEEIVRSRMRARHVSFKQALNDVIREGVAGGEEHFFTTPSRSMGLKKDVTKANQVAAMLNDEETLRKLAAES
ncbi:MAG: antitoxin [Aeromicrobium sp.]|nr:MAG: antitoxin [Aeromicrobium sp.]